MGRDKTKPQRRNRARQAGVYHRLEKGETLSLLSRAYRVPVATLMEVNGIREPESIRAHTPIFIPGATRALPLDATQPAIFAWPLEGRITSPFSLEGRHRHHEGIDIDGNLGQRIRSAAAGRVLQAGKDGRYGNAVLIDHGDGLTTFYAHASKLWVHAGERVEGGEVIAEVGSSGNARGTHLHFETRRDGHPMNPLKLLPDAGVLQVHRR